MATNQNLSFINGSKATATGTYAEEEIQMPEARGSLLPAIKEIWIEHPQMATLANKYSKWHLSIKSQDSICNISDDDVIIAGHQHQNTAIGASNPIEQVTFALPVAISRDKIYIGFMQDSGNAHTYNYRIGWLPRYVKGVVQAKSLNTIDF